MTPEFFADIDRAAEQQQAQYQSTQQPLSYQPISRSESPLPGKGPAVERARASGERSSPLNPENAQQRGRREQLVARESPKTQNRQPASPIVQAFPQGQSHSPERRMSPLQHSPLIIPGEPHPSSYLAQYNAREAAAAAAAASVRRAQNNEARLNAPAIQGQSGQTIAARTPDRSLPVQEEDEVASKNNTGTNVSNAWQMKEGIAEDAFRAPSPTPSSDLNPEGNVQRYEPHQVNAHQATHPDEEKAVPIQDEDAHPKYPDRDSTEEEGSYTPRSPTAGLPEDNHFSGQNIPVRVPVPVSHRSKGRNGATEHVMRGLETTLLEQQQQQKAPTAPVLQGQVPSERPPQYADQRQQPPSIGNPNPNGHQYQNYSPAQEYSTNQGHGTQLSPSDERYISPQVYPDDFHSYGEDSTSAYIQSYLGSPRPDAPIPPTPHSQTAAPSPSPYYPSYVPKDMPVPSRRFHAGSPYPYPFNHVRRQRPQPSRFGTFPNGVDPNDLTEKIARQWQVYAQNNQGSVTDSTLSPRSTPFQDHMYDHWAYLHTQRMMGTAMLDTASMQSSPSHQPVPLPMPNFASRKKEKSGTPPRRTYTRKPPPRVESTQPRDTSPELSSSGEETAGEDKTYSTTKEGILAPDPLPFPVVDTPTTTVDGDDEGDWVDEEDEDDLDDLIDLEYHPDFIKNVSKRRRKWEVGWENLIQAVRFTFLCPSNPFSMNAFIFSVPSIGSPDRRDHDIIGVPVAYHQASCPQITINPQAALPVELCRHESHPLRFCSYRGRAPIFPSTQIIFRRWTSRILYRQRRQWYRRRLRWQFGIWIGEHCW